MPFGITPAPEIFQQRIHEALAGLKGVHVVVDDILTVGEGETTSEAQTDHDRKLTAFLQRCREKGIKLNKSNVRFRVPEVSYLGHLLTPTGIRPDPAKVKAITNMERPTTVAGVQRILGMANYLARFIDRISDICEPMRQLVHKHNAWNWTDIHDQSFEQLKQALTNAPGLKYYDPAQELTVQCDASETGLGAAAMQLGQPIAYASRAMTETKCRYAQIEKELLAIVFALEKFHQYTYGRSVNIQTDQKPYSRNRSSKHQNAYNVCYYVCNTMISERPTVKENIYVRSRHSITRLPAYRGKLIVWTSDGTDSTNAISL